MMMQAATTSRSHPTIIARTIVLPPSQLQQETIH
jgi:hypothetical protein